MKLPGRMRYAADVRVDGLLQAAVLRSSYPHARIDAIDTSAAARLPGVHLVLTGRDIPAVRYGRRVRDVPLLAVGKVRFAGERVAAVVADSRAQAVLASKMGEFAQPLLRHKAGRTARQFAQNLIAALG
ncbi:MAG TPA: hypothetical protein VGX97_00740 [bacterium]|nr:hypothetical protein [bacterium]